MSSVLFTLGSVPYQNGAFAGDPAYNDLMLAFAALFSPRPPAHAVSLLESALEALPPDSDTPLGEPYSLMERESGSLGAMGAGQWTGQFRTRPHALLDVRQFSTVDEYTKSLSRGGERRRPLFPLLFPIPATSF